MTSTIAVCLDGEFQEAGALGGYAISCTGTLVNEESPATVVDLSSEEIGELAASVLAFFVVCACIKWVRYFFDSNSSGRSG
jgi:hypothetical protein